MIISRNSNIMQITEKQVFLVKRIPGMHGAAFFCVGAGQKKIFWGGAGQGRAKQQSNSEQEDRGVR